MTTLVITPNVKRKTLKLEGRIAAGEHVLVRVETFDDKVGEGKSLRLRAVGPKGDTLAVFPPQVKDDDPPRPQEELVWQVDGGDATCVFDFNTVQAEKFLRCGGECLFVLDDAENHTLYGNGFCTVAPWAKVPGLDSPVDLDGYIDLGDRVTEVENGIASVGEKASLAAADASSAKVAAADAARVADTARADAVAAGNAAISAESSASAAAASAASASAYADAASSSASDAAYDAKAASDKFDSLSEVAKSGDYSDLQNRPEIPSIDGLATKDELSHEEDRAKGVENDILNRLSKTPSLDDGGKVPASQLPSYVDDVIEYGDRTRFPMFGESGKIYVDMSTNHLYRWTGTVYVQIPAGLSLGETASSAYPGNKGLENAQGIANLKTSKQDKLDAKQLAAVNSGVTASKLANMVSKDDVVPLGDGTEVIATIGGKQIKAPAGGGSGDRISDSDGNVINADGTCTFRGAPWICDGTVLEVQPDGSWASEDRSIALRHNAGEWYFYASPWGASHFTAPSTATELTAVIGERTWNLKLKTVDLSKSVMPDDVQPLGSGTEVIATIGGKEIKAPAGGGGVGTVKKVANVSPDASGNVPLTAADVNAFPSDGGKLEGPLWFGDEYGFGFARVRDMLEIYYGALFLNDGLSAIMFGSIGEPTTLGDELGRKATTEQVTAVSEKVDEIKDAVSTDNRFLVDGTTAAIQERGEGGEWDDENPVIRFDKGYDAKELETDATETVALDKSVQTVITHAANLIISIPEGATGTVRDFCIYVFNQNQSDGSATAISASDSSISVFQDENDSAKWTTECPAGGQVAIYLTEIPGMGWRASRSVLKRAEDIA